MRYQFFFLFLCFFVHKIALAQNKVQLSSSFKDPILKELLPFFTPSEGHMEDLLEGQVFSIGEATSPTESEQQMMLFVAGVHPKNCTKVMRKLSLYENYHTYMDFIKSSSYDEKAQKISFTIDHALLPFPMLVGFNIPRITKEGRYPFTFKDGFLKDLKGVVIVKEVGKYCLLSLKTDWRGPQSKIPNVIFGTFVQTVGKLGLEHLIRVSLF